LKALDARLHDVAPRVTATDDDEAVHDLRVALRRTRTMLEVARRVLGRYPADEVRRALREIQRATGALRDEEVLLDLVGSLGSAHPDAASWLEARRRRERRLRRALVRIIRAGDLEQGQRLLEALVAFRIKPTRDRRLPKFARRAVDAARRDVERKRAAAPEDVAALHRLRIAYKRLRYTVEMFGDVVPSDVAALGPPAARVQGRLGDLHDVDMAIGCVRRARALSEAARIELLAALGSMRHERLAAYAKEQGIPAAAVTTAEHPQAVGGTSLRKISTR
jgi:CHAD domain-containing protein